MESKNIVIFGSTGMLGSALLIEALASEDIGKVLLVNRKSIGYTHEKMEEIIHDDFYNPQSLADDLKNIDACFFCLGTTSVGKNEEQYTRITYDLTKAIAELYHSIQPSGTFIYISGTGTDSTEKGNTMWARVKGKTENMIMDLFKDAYMFRPGYIQPMKGVKSSTNWYQWLYNIFGFLYPLLKRIAPNSMMSTVDLSNAMLNAMRRGYHKRILETRHIIELSQQSDD